MTELEQLRGECAMLRDVAEEYRRVLEFEILNRRERRDIRYLNEEEALEELYQKLASSPLSEKYAAVVSAAEECIRWSKLDCATGLYSKLVDAVDALQEAVSK